jgi:hypothetical protein
MVGLLDGLLLGLPQIAGKPVGLPSRSSIIRRWDHPQRDHPWHSSAMLKISGLIGASTKLGM